MDCTYSGPSTGGATYFTYQNHFWQSRSSFAIFLHLKESNPVGCTYPSPVYWRGFIRLYENQIFFAIFFFGQKEFSTI